MKKMLIRGSIYLTIWQYDENNYLWNVRGVIAGCLHLCLKVLFV